MEDELLEGGIFENKDEVVENIKSAAENAGLSPEVAEKIGQDGPKKAYYAKKNCNWCWGRGLVDFVKNGVSVPSRKKEFSKTLSRSVNITKSKLDKTINRLSLLNAGDAALGRDTYLPEDTKDMTKVLCKCVKVLVEE